MALAWALIGVLGGHVLTYAVLYPDAHVHDRVLQASGHGWTGMLAPALLTSAVVAVSLGLLGGTRHGDARVARFTTLLALQLGLFAGLELAERIASAGLTLASLEHHLFDHGLAQILLVGSIVQVVTAWCGSRVSRAVAAVARMFGARPARRRLAHRRLVHVLARAIGAPPRSAHAIRGPPFRFVRPSLIR
jgi:hypothetical protein